MLVPSGELQNFVEVERDWSDLEAKMTYYLAHPKEAERIAANAVKAFRQRYLTPAAEACYWRRLIRGYAEVSEEPSFYKADGTSKGRGEREWRGVPFESFILTRRLEWPVS